MGGRTMLTATFDITIDGELHPDFALAFEPAAVTCRDGQTVVRATSIDQAALHGILDEIAAQGLTLLSVEQISSDDD